MGRKLKKHLSIDEQIGKIKSRGLNIDDYQLNDSNSLFWRKLFAGGNLNACVH